MSHFTNKPALNEWISIIELHTIEVKKRILERIVIIQNRLNSSQEEKKFVIASLYSTDLYIFFKQLEYVHNTNSNLSVMQDLMKSMDHIVVVDTFV